MVSYISGIELARGFYFDIVQNLIDSPHAAALLGEGSEVLGYDQPRSMDHAFGPRMQIFVHSTEIDTISNAVERGLPKEYKGYPVQFYSWQDERVKHHVEITTLDNWLMSQLRFSHVSELTPAKWLAMPQQHLLQFISGAVFRDDIGELQEMRNQLSWYPIDVWLWMMASQWHLIGNIQHFIGRTAEASDVRGSSLISFRLVHLIMELSFLQERRYWPYLKWFGTAFSKLNIAPILAPKLDAILQSGDQETRENEINSALLLMAERHNSLELTRVVTPMVDNFQVGINNAVRPYRVLNAGDFANACIHSIKDEKIRRLQTVGSIDQLTHADDVLINFTSWPHHFNQLYQHHLENSLSE
ncbi:DUF4037 domain-containing protein [Alicyclobacillus fastidiosus]|uniref:DUF4037 domain-containing protein n=1 Tax=Alicyclobacillus fastidiosus TaxID=392011 RepID=A0ABY6ZPX0_9BACL|nr:DUF4037 domain-containing protein [Alicyclobacillus fastidiosus]WAH44141.1 DUF4037 domain-containing protein [Alicyclobacillus fastidiosus]GMA60444.1 hypothetical protein GCM10025859_08840 [Alicyclobacillus fastidiosus]